MKSSDRAILMGLALAGLVAAFYFLILAPKREEAATLGDEVTALQSEVAEQQQLAADGEAAKRDFDGNYRRLVVLGKAVPEDEDTSSLLTQLTSLSHRSGVDFRGLVLSQSAAAATTPAPTGADLTQTDTSSDTSTDSSTDASSTDTSTDTSTETSTTTVTAPATESAASTLPIGAAVGPAGLPVMPYDLTFKGGFFQVADFLGAVNGMVHLRDGKPLPDGRLLTVDGFDLVGESDKGFPRLDASLAVTTYVTPADQGLLAGASASAPAPASPAPSDAGSETTPAPIATATP